MCLTACHYAGIDRVVFGARLKDMDAITGNELRVSHADLLSGQDNGLIVTGDFLRQECCDLLYRWSGNR